MCTHDNINAFIDVGRSLAEDILENDDPEDALIGIVPFFHSFGFMLLFMNILRGKTMICMDKFSPLQFLDVLVRYKISRIFVPPPILLFLLKHPAVSKYDLSFIKEIRSGAAPMGQDMERALKKRFNIDKVSQGYGMTETTLAVLSTMKDAKPGSSGKIVPGMMVKVIDADGKTLGPYQEGELCFKGPLIMKGYVGDPEATRNTIDRENWLHTGDIGYYDDEGFFFIVDRIKELIKYKGFQVAPAELEALLVAHPSIEDAGVIGLPNEEAGELPLAFVVKRPGRDISALEIEKYVEREVSPQKRLRGGVVFLKEIPRNPTGKILRRVLKQRAVELKSKL